MSNFSGWQSENILRRRGHVLDVIERLRKYKSKFSSITELAKFIADEVSSAESKSGFANKIDSSTLLRRSGPYRALLDSFFIDISLSAYCAGDGYISTDAVANRILLSKSLEISSVSKSLSVALDEIVRLKCTIGSLKNNKLDSDFISTDVLVHSMARVAEILFEILLSTDYFEFDSGAGNIILVGRSRKIVVSSTDLAPYLNYVRRNEL